MERSGSEVLTRDADLIIKTLEMFQGHWYIFIIINFI